MKRKCHLYAKHKWSFLLCCHFGIEADGQICVFNH